MAINHGVGQSVRYHFYDSKEAMKFIEDMKECGRIVVNFGYDKDRKITKYFVDIE